jgi:hypothetical protein
LRERGESCICEEMTTLKDKSVEMTTSLLKRGDGLVCEVNGVLEIEREERGEHEFVGESCVVVRIESEARVREEEDVFKIEMCEVKTGGEKERNALVSKAIETTEVEMS